MAAILRHRCIGNRENFIKKDKETRIKTITDSPLGERRLPPWNRNSPSGVLKGVAGRNAIFFFQPTNRLQLKRYLLGKTCFLNLLYSIPSGRKRRMRGGEEGIKEGGTQTVTSSVTLDKFIEHNKIQGGTPACHDSVRVHATRPSSGPCETSENQSGGCDRRRGAQTLSRAFDSRAEASPARGTSQTQRPNEADR